MFENCLRLAMLLMLCGIILLGYGHPYQSHIWRKCPIQRFGVPFPSILEGKTPKLGFKPKQSLGQNYLSDQNYVLKICNALESGCLGESIQSITAIKEGRRVLELGPGTGALSTVLVKRYPNMLAIELDARAIEALSVSCPDLTVLGSDVLQVDYRQLAALRGGPLVVIGNLPYYITSQILFSFVDCAPAVRRAVVTMQWEVAQRMVAKPFSKDYGILSVVFQLYATSTLNFKIPPTVFYPQPQVFSALCTIDFPNEREPFPVAASDLRRVIVTSFQQRRKMLRNSLQCLIEEAGGKQLPKKWAEMRPEEVLPREFVELTLIIYGSKPELAEGQTRVWRHSQHGDW